MAERASGRSPSPEEVLPLGVQGARPPESSAGGGSSARSLDAGSSAEARLPELFCSYWLHYAEHRAGLRQEWDLSPTTVITQRSQKSIGR